MIHRIEDEYGVRFCISAHRCWIPGAYDSERAARYAFRFRDEALIELRDKVCDENEDFCKRVITFEMLQEYRRKHKNDPIQS